MTDMDQRNKFIGLGFLLLAVAPLHGAMPRYRFYEHNDEGLRPRREVRIERQRYLMGKIYHRLGIIDKWIETENFDRIQKELQSVLYPRDTLTMPEAVRLVLQNENYQIQLIEKIWKAFGDSDIIYTKGLFGPIFWIIHRMSPEHQDMIHKRTNSDPRLM